MQANIELNLNGTKATISLENGAAISAFSVRSQSGEKILMTMHPRHRFENAWLFPFPNRLKNGRFEFEGKEYQFPLNDDDQRPNALHGFINNKHFSLVNHSEKSCELIFNYKGELAYYPFPCTIKIRYELIENGLNTEVIIENKGTTQMPFGLGWHPYFDINEGVDLVKLKMPCSAIIELDESGIPKGSEHPSYCFEELSSLAKRNLDDCFRVSHSGKNITEVQFSTGETLQVWQKEEYPFIQVYTHPERRSLAVEPMSCGVNALNTYDGLTVLAPNESKHFSAGVCLIF